MAEYKFRKLAEEFYSRLTKGYPEGAPIEQLAAFLEEIDKAEMRRAVAFKGAIEALPGHVKLVINGDTGEIDGKAMKTAVKWLTDQFEAIILGK